MDRMKIEHAAVVFGPQLVPKGTSNIITFRHTLYDGSSGFKTWVNEIVITDT